MARTLVISNRKGGSGKTATSVNLAAELAARGQRVLLIDMDSQGHCALGLGVRYARSEPSLHGFMAGRHPLSDAVRPRGCAGLDLIPGDPLFEHGSGRAGDTLLRQALIDEGLQDRYDFIVLDTPPSLDALMLNALHAADRVLVPFVPHFLAGEGVRQLARVLFQIASQSEHPGLKVLGFLPVMLDSRIGLHRQVQQSLGQQFGAQRLLPGIRNDIRVAEAFAAGRPLRDFAPTSRAAADYADATTALLERWA